MPGIAIPVRCEQAGAVCRSLDGTLTFTRQNGALYAGSDGKFYSGGSSGGGVSVMFEVLDARHTPSPALPGLPGLGGTMTGSDRYGTVSGLHDWYLILLALVTLYVLMRVFPTWGRTVGWIILLGAVLATESAVTGFQGLVRTIQTGTIQ